jgi:hypothetical protein
MLFISVSKRSVFNVTRIQSVLYTSGTAADFTMTSCSNIINSCGLYDDELLQHQQ